MKLQFLSKFITLTDTKITNGLCTSSGECLVSDASKFANLSASAQVKSGSGYVKGVIINSHTGGTLKLWNSLTAADAIICNTITFGATERWIPLFGAKFSIGLYATIGGTADITILYN